ERKPMRFKCILTTALLLAASTFAQTVTELLQKGIYAQETSGNYDEAILIFRQIVNSASGQREIAAQAQYRLAQSLIQKGDLSTAAVEFQKLASTYPDQQALISKVASRLEKTAVHGPEHAQQTGETQEFLEAQIR